MSQSDSSRMFQPELEAMPVEERAKTQLVRLQDLVGRLADGPNQFWNERLDGVSSGDVSELGDLAELPFTTKSDLRDAYPFGLLAVPSEQTVRVHASSGTSGKPTIVAYTRDDVGVFSEVVARSIACAGGRPDDVLHVAYGYGLFTGGLGLHFGAEQLGTTVVPASGGNTQLQLQLLADLAADGLACTPSFGMLLAERAAQAGLEGLKVRYLICGAEPWSAGFREKLEAAWSELTGAPTVARDIYGLSEIIGPGVAQECVEAPGAMHIFDDHFLPEIIDPDTGEVLPEGERGELVITTLTKQALPLIRYRTGDVTHLERGTCECGRTHPKIGRIVGRTDDMLIIRGVNVFPRAIESTIMEEPDLNGAYAIVIDRRPTLPKLDIYVEVADHLDPEPELEHRLHDELSSRLRLNAEVHVEPANTLPRTE
ncbi:MAG: phenylacetate--CoA ligase, partial [Nitriliruptorales bacterium]|nr:phenylacetate--CoA ligase [Nitriliruptorales bacterium]